MPSQPNYFKWFEGKMNIFAYVLHYSFAIGIITLIMFLSVEVVGVYYRRFVSRTKRVMHDVAINRENPKCFTTFAF